MSDKMDYFELLGLPRSFRIDGKALEEGYRRVELQVHPDRFASASPAVRRVAEQWAQRANEARATLSDPLKRAVYLCEAAGCPVEAESNTRMPVDFLMQQLDWRERLESGKGDADALARLRAEGAAERDRTIARIGETIDERKSPKDAVPDVRRLMFIDKMSRDIASVEKP